MPHIIFIITVLLSFVDQYRNLKHDDRCLHRTERVLQ